VKKNADAITKPDLSITAKIFDLQFTEQEIDSMYDNVKELNQAVKQLHSLPLDNNVPMSLWQSPLVPGIQFNTNQEPIEWNIPSDEQLPKNKNDLAFYSIPQLASLIKNKKITSVELTQFLLIG
jgi:hypothetical protein